MAQHTQHIQVAIDKLVRPCNLAPRIVELQHIELEAIQRTGQVTWPLDQHIAEDPRKPSPLAMVVAVNTPLVTEASWLQATLEFIEVELLEVLKPSSLAFVMA